MTHSIVFFLLTGELCVDLIQLYSRLNSIFYWKKLPAFSFAISLCSLG
jgi:hypothetical protein